MWRLTVLSQRLSDKEPENLGSGGKSLEWGAKRGGDFLVSPLSSLGFSRYDPVVEPQGLERGEGLANVSPQYF